MKNRWGYKVRNSYQHVLPGTEQTSRSIPTSRSHFFVNQTGTRKKRTNEELKNFMIGQNIINFTVYLLLLDLKVNIIK